MKPLQVITMPVPCDLPQRIASLTPRERDVFGLVIQGRLNKQIGSQLGASEETIKLHRFRMMRKMGLVSVAELVVSAVSAGLLKIVQSQPVESRK